MRGTRRQLMQSACSIHARLPHRAQVFIRSASSSAERRASSSSKPSAEMPASTEPMNGRGLLTAGSDDDVSEASIGRKLELLGELVVNRLRCWKTPPLSFGGGLQRFGGSCPSPSRRHHGRPPRLTLGEHRGDHARNEGPLHGAHLPQPGMWRSHCGSASAAGLRLHTRSQGARCVTGIQCTPGAEPARAG